VPAALSAQARGQQVETILACGETYRYSVNDNRVVLITTGQLHFVTCQRLLFRQAIELSGQSSPTAGFGAVLEAGLDSTPAAGFGAELDTGLDSPLAAFGALLDAGLDSTPAAGFGAELDTGLGSPPAGFGALLDAGLDSPLTIFGAAFNAGLAASLPADLATGAFVVTGASVVC